MVFAEESAASGRVLIIGHRGAAGLQPENTLPSFAEGVRLGVDAVELDVHAVEGELAVIHDDRLERTTNGKGHLNDCSFARLRTLDAGAGATVPVLNEVFDILPATVAVNIELKGSGTAALVAGYLNEHPDYDVLVSSFDHDELRAFHRARSEVAVAPLFSRWRDNVWQVAEELGAWSVNLSLRIATAQRIAEAHERGYRVLVYTVNELEVARQLAATGVDGVFTDRPDRITPASLSG